MFMSSFSQFSKIQPKTTKTIRVTELTEREDSDYRVDKKNTKIAHRMAIIALFIRSHNHKLKQYIKTG